MVLEIEYHSANLVSAGMGVLLVILGQWLPSLRSSTVLVTMSLLSIRMTIINTRLQASGLASSDIVRHIVYHTQQ